MSNSTITVEQVQAKTVRETVAICLGDQGIKKLVYIFPIASGVPYWRVVIDGRIESDHLELVDAVAAYNAG